MTPAPPPTKPALPADQPLQPPAEEFWEKYSPHFEFPISLVSACAIYVVTLAFIVYIVYRAMHQVDPDKETPPVPVRSVTMQNGLGGPSGDQGSGGGNVKSEATDDQPPRETRPPIPEVELNKKMAEAKSWRPDLKDDPAALKEFVESPNFRVLDVVNEEMKKRIGAGTAKKQGDSNDAGTGGTGPEGKGKGGPGDATSSDNRANRYVIVFKTSNGEDYLRQLAAFEAKIVMPEPPDWKRNRLFEVITEPNPGKLLTEADQLPPMRFVDNNRTSAKRVARALGLDYDPPYFIAFFPKRVEDELAAKERAFRNRREDQIRETEFSVIDRGGKLEIRVTQQISK
jgi:hypothetical protein